MTRRIFITGGGGFLGSAIAKRLLRVGNRVTVFARSDYPTLRELGAETLRGSITDNEALTQASANHDLVFHVAAKAGVWGSYQSYFDANVLGTRNVIAACRANDIPELVYTSSPSVTFSGADQSGVDESEPYPEKYLAHYPATKAIAEREVLEANSEELRTVALRPHLIWGEGDPHLMPRIIERAKAGKLKLVGDGSNRVDSTCVENAAVAHLQAATELGGEGKCAGKAYFISNDDPLTMRDLITRILDAGGVPAVEKSVSPSLAYTAGAVLESIYRLFGKQDEPIMTRFVARQLSTDHWFDLSAAKRDFDYRPEVTQEEGFSRLKKWLR